jgi:phosphoglycerate dehydrogenase-like enzyme
LVGYGAIGRHAARVLAAMGMRVHGLKRHADQDTQGVERLFARDQLLEAVALADHVACILPSDTGTDRLIDSAVLEQMKPSAFLYNLGRGNAVDETALGVALRSGRIAGAFLDVVADEPLPDVSALWNLPNLYLTPHASAICDEYLDLYFEELGELLAGLS